MGATGNVTGLHLHYEIRKKSNRYGDIINPCEYMGIPNYIGFFNSKNYEISDVPKFVKGDIVKIPCKFTGAAEENKSMIEIDNFQCWAYNSYLNKEKNKVDVTICFVDTYKIMVEIIDAKTMQRFQFWISNSEVVK